MTSILDALKQPGHFKYYKYKKIHTGIHKLFILVFIQVNADKSWAYNLGD